jgi:hypothetical protein
MPRFDLLGRPQPLVGIVIIAAGWALAHQVGSDSVLDACYDRGGGFVVLVSLIGLAIVAAGGLYCLRSRSDERGKRFLGTVGALLALLAGFNLVLQVAAGLIIPACAA